MTNILGEVAQGLVDVIPILLGFLGYATTVRSSIAKKYGPYLLGLIDGFIMTLTGMAVVFYIQSFFA